MAHIFSVITDEVSPALSVGLGFAVGEGLSVVDIRSIGGVNFLSLPREKQTAAAREIKDAGLKVGCFATPLLKWLAPGQKSADVGDQFGFDAGGRSIERLYADAFRAAELLGTRNLRIFSYLSYSGFKPSDLDAEYGKLLRLAEAHDCVLHVENEHVCNIATVADLGKTLPRWNHPRLRGLLDIPNSWRAGCVPSDADVDVAMAFVDQIHVKDYSAASGGFVPLGEGDVPFAIQLPICFKAAGPRDLALVIETHVPQDQPGATRRSLAALRRLVEAGA